MILLLSIHLAMSILYLVLWWRKNKKESVCRFLIVFTMPVFGMLCLIFLHYLNKVFLGKGQIDYEGLVSKRNYARFIEKPDFEKEINVVPLEDILSINENKTKRKKMIEVLKKDVKRHIGFLRIALNDEDTETVHYAASAIVAIKRDFDLSMQEMAVTYEADRGNQETAAMYAEILNEYLRSGLLDSGSERRFLYTYINVLKGIVDSADSTKAEEQHFCELVDRLLSLGEYDQARIYCAKFLEEHALSERAYLANLKIYYELNDAKTFFDMMERLKKSQIILSNYTLNVVRFWSVRVPRA